jgi:hypothetical protein
VRIWLSRGGKTISAKKKIMMFLQVAALAALLARRIVILQSWAGYCAIPAFAPAMKTSHNPRSRLFKFI